MRPTFALKAPSGSTCVQELCIQPHGSSQSKVAMRKAGLSRAASAPHSSVPSITSHGTWQEVVLQPSWLLWLFTAAFSRSVQRAQAAPRGPSTRTEPQRSWCQEHHSWNVCWIRLTLFLFLAFIEEIMFKKHGVIIVELCFTWLFWISYYTLTRYSSCNTVRAFAKLFQSYDYRFKIRG